KTPMLNSSVFESRAASISISITLSRTDASEERSAPTAAFGGVFIVKSSSAAAYVLPLKGNSAAVRQKTAVMRNIKACFIYLLFADDKCGNHSAARRNICKLRR